MLLEDKTIEKKNLKFLEPEETFCCGCKQMGPDPLWRSEIK